MDWELNWSQRIVPGEESPFVSVTSGVPQRTALRPLLFLIYINDMPNSVSFADDTHD